ncbi:acyloxyacyl hydrolase [Polaribacter sp. PL03]|uniref:acyloxyacyl hydrolase n=1 Tax=Polaribacter sp. PL03 TaxID=3088353 RepID=UPI0029CB9FF0|nr:acyloxyacyl hydrolase [Polaribacter sp. PL03]MDX6746121.1 acyloxyacyl hydrolase [Polaribacter sp. PL03]
MNIKKIGFLYNNANEKNFIFDDIDYTYETNTYKLQAFYNLGSWKSLNFDLIVQPQIQVLKHQLINEQFVLPSEENYREKRTEFTTPKTMYLYALELGFVLRKELFKNLDFVTTIGLGLATIDTRTERLAKGFTFIENGSLGLSYKTSAKTYLYIGSNIGHVSNFDTQKPNNGYSFLGYEIGISYKLK